MQPYDYLKREGISAFSFKKARNIGFPIMSRFP